MHHYFLSWTVLLTTLVAASPVLAQRSLTEVPDTDPTKEQASFQVAEGFEVNLFASEPMIAKPIQMNWDSQGRLWVATSETYPHVKPGQDANDKIILLEDTDDDGVADKSTVFADGLLMPTAILPGDGGVYVGNSTELLHLKDTDGDGKADERRIVLSGFGTEDTHHIIHTLKRGPAGHIYFNQSIYTHSHIETPYGVKRLLAGGTWKFDSTSLELEVFCRGLVNPWGLAFDSYGQAFETDGAGGEGIHYVFPDVVMLTAHNAERIVRGLNPGQPKHCGLEILAGDHLPEGWSGRFVTNDFRGNRINSFELSESGSGYISRQADNLMTSNYISFRPVDILMGPDGAIYVADWYNPIIQHGEVDFRDERRDHEHGRIWRISVKDNAPGRQLLPADASVPELVTMLNSDQKWYRDMARYELSKADRNEVFQAIDTAAKSNTDPEVESQLALSRMWLAEDWSGTEEALRMAELMLTHDDYRVRSAAVRVAAQWTDNPLAVGIFKTAIADSHPQVRLEAVHALRHQATPTSLKLASTAVDPANDRFLEFSLWQTFRTTEEIWLPLFVEDPGFFGDNPRTILTIAQASRSAAVVAPVVKMWEQGQIPDNLTGEVLQLVSERGNVGELTELWKLALDENNRHRAAILEALAQTALRRKAQPSESLTELIPLLDAKDSQVRWFATRLAGLWKIETARPNLKAIAENETESAARRGIALQSLALLGGTDSRDYLLAVARGESMPKLQVAGIEALLSMNVKLAAEAAVAALSEEGSAARVDTILGPLLQRRDGPGHLAQALKGAKWPAGVATAAVRRATSLPQQNPGLVAAIQKAGGIDPLEKELSPEEMQELVQAIVKTGDAHRGEEIYRREKLLCIKCHAVGGAGGKVGPDLSSIGASAPVDYLVESLINPSKKIKEGYHSIQVVTIDGIVLAGVPVLENQDEIHLRDAEGKIHVVPTEDIELRKNSTVSLMPADLVSKLRRDELIDLVRFLSALGKTGELVVSKQQMVRTWQVINPEGNIRGINDAIRHAGIQLATTDDSQLSWTTHYSHVDGGLRLQPLVNMRNIDGATLSIARFEIDVIQPGVIGLKIENPTGLRIWIDEEEVGVQPHLHPELPVGKHRVTIAADPGARKNAPIRAELIEVPGSQGQATLLN
ncbi:PVC-type heme-binding CxxCH protein [Rubinisphaera margarita]|uniref:PVC-type heme-binding CxxCH protein n=1 Tax=Rubinisphaera margarita TaxID=2909586 RepID=UPI001EE892EE|nr:PVC-type heme-binding CxxCH protein [Rubinisphaera margarita]MCG6157781.1 c-type cytochrome [Rubinisphaera margarita]